MTDCNVGGRKGRSSLDNIFIASAISNNVRQKKSDEDTYFMIMDFMQMFDSTNLKKAIIDASKVGLTTDNLNILYEANTNVTLAVKGPHLNSEESNLEACIMQGDTMGSILATAQMQDISNYYETNASDHVY